MKAFDLLERFFETPSPTKLKLKLLDKALQWAIPFNSPHKFKLQELTPEKVVISVPFKRVNQNHLKGIHACAIATVGEYSAGVGLIRNLGPSRYRLILAKLEAEYKFQGKTDLRAEAQFPADQLNQLKQDLINQESTYITITTNLTDKKGNVVALVHSTWQVKDWKKVRTKV